MAKLVILLCAVLFASAVNASFVSDSLIFAINKTDHIVTGIISETKHKLEDIKNKALKLTENLEAAAKLSGDKLFEKIKATLEQVQLDVNKLTGKNDSYVDVTDCNKLVSHLEYTAYVAVGNMSKCVVDKLETGNGYVQSIITLSENVLANLTTIKEKSHHCADNVQNIVTAADAIVCANMAAFEAKWVVAKTVPSVMIKMTKITYLAATLQPSLVYCSINKEIATFYHESSIILEKTKQCIREKIEQARPDGLEVEYSTEKILEALP